ncbi:MAG: hypothetical protein IRZ09_02555 [Variibacter sp.]|nr:hypothetical protein [Variibacter sp.]
MASFVDNVLGFALRRVRLLTVLLLFGAPWLIVTYAPSWEATIVALAAMAAFACLGAAARLWFSQRRVKRNGT